MIKEGLVVFYDTHDSIKADNICLSQNVNADLVPVHPNISLGCGFMLKTDWNNFSSLIQLLESEDIRYRALYYSEKLGIKREIELLYEDEN
ncbi:MAG: DUF3343 domain-containing protein [Leptotrichiaceae bacterium]|nr:DUF3343 domain-containing protein [Leptotrichiaceae bacterium]